MAANGRLPSVMQKIPAASALPLTKHAAKCRRHPRQTPARRRRSSGRLRSVLPAPPEAGERSLLSRFIELRANAFSNDLPLGHFGFASLVSGDSTFEFLSKARVIFAQHAGRFCAFPESLRQLKSLVHRKGDRSIEHVVCTRTHACIIAEMDRRGKSQPTRPSRIPPTRSSRS